LTTPEVKVLGSNWNEGSALYYDTFQEFGTDEIHDRLLWDSKILSEVVNAKKQVLFFWVHPVIKPFQMGRHLNHLLNS
jgi:hypothetical protein